jgi:hypothetical protein
MCSSGLGALSCPFSTKFLRSTYLRFTTSSAIATYTLLQAGLLSSVIDKSLAVKVFAVSDQLFLCRMWVAKKLKHRREGRKKLNLSCGGAGILFAKFWLVCRLVRLGKECACCIGYSYIFLSFSALSRSVSVVAV